VDFRASSWRRTKSVTCKSDHHRHLQHIMISRKTCTSPHEQKFTAVAHKSWGVRWRLIHRVCVYRFRLGAVHDGSPPPTYLGGPGAEKCRWEDGYIMSDLRHTEKGFRWSPCSVSSFHHFLKCVQLVDKLSVLLWDMTGARK